uniref:Probable RNA 2'-phosphotransferase n=1 Tax=uncultured Nocardioidaceae bacterium TaxID=253824 RepID=A0A6J4M9H8_9ACTN|nr:MAG: RNA:NAD 2'-phosphotransferase [uncultured Nocardioidaceae bacterium]
MPDRHRQLSKAVAHALRHQPRQYGLELDGHGWTSVSDLLEGLIRRRPGWQLRREDLVTMIEASDKRRFEIDGDRIRALYGHSVPGRILKPRSRPPELLFHGTAPTVVPAILAEGLRPMTRQYVHLSVDVQTAHVVGRRRCAVPVILEVAAGEADRAGVEFWCGNDDVWLAESVPPAYVRVGASME